MAILDFTPVLLETQRKLRRISFFIAAETPAMKNPSAADAAVPGWVAFVPVRD
jgi:hypothetical protein